MTVPTTPPTTPDCPTWRTRSADRIVRTEPGGPTLVEGPVDLIGRDDDVVHADRFVVAVCTCRRSKIYPLCDTSHRPRVRER
jgi:hypothetical protein